MQYVMSDIHGCYGRFLKILDTIGFSDTDSLYILGDSLDRGPDSIPLLRDLSLRTNVFHIIGDHEFMAIRCLRAIGNAALENTKNRLNNDEITAMLNWLADGGEPTMKGFGLLAPEEREGLLEYLEDMPLYDIAEAGGHKFVLTHAGISNFRQEKPLDEYEVGDLLFDAPDYGRRYFNDAYFITGHIPTRLTSPEGSDKIFRNRKGHIAIDCGASYGGKLACLCLDTLEDFYA